eukprot:Tbor_TRINITY_DN5496_c0_g4::TRINITY_DN5496_c0_g4_i3::g.24980::m.24980
MMKEWSENPAEQRDMFLRTYLLPRDIMLAIALETLGVKAFANKEFLEVIHRRLKRLCPQLGKGKGSGRHWVLHKDIEKRPKTIFELPQKSKITTKVKPDFNVLYKPKSGNFPVVDGFFFVDRPKTMVCIQTTVRDEHSTTTSKVKALKEELNCHFKKWDKFSINM